MRRSRQELIDKGVLKEISENGNIHERLRYTIIHTLKTKLFSRNMLVKYTYTYLKKRALFVNALCA